MLSNVNVSDRVSIVSESGAAEPQRGEEARGGREEADCCGVFMGTGSEFGYLEEGGMARDEGQKMACRRAGVLSVEFAFRSRAGLGKR